jgi:hypothetical protein
MQARFHLTRSVHRHTNHTQKYTAKVGNKFKPNVRNPVFVTRTREPPLKKEIVELQLPSKLDIIRIIILCVFFCFVLFCLFSLIK